MTRRLALLGATSGPWVDISRLRHAALDVTGLPEGAVVTVMLSGPQGVVEISSNGTHTVPKAQSAQVSVAHSKKHMTICAFVSCKVA